MFNRPELVVLGRWDGIRPGYSSPIFLVTSAALIGASTKWSGYSSIVTVAKNLFRCLLNRM